MNKKIFALGYGLGLALPLLLVWRLAFAQPDIALASLDLLTLDGQPVTVAQLAGRPVVVNYWATWCGPCLQEFPLFEQARRQVDPAIQFVMLSDEPAPKIQAFLQKHPYPFTFWRVAKALPKVSSRPATYVFDHTGRLVDKRVGSFAGVKDIVKMVAPVTK